MSRKAGDGPRSQKKVDLQVGSRLRARRRRAVLSRSELADALGASVQQLRDNEDGAVRLSASRLVRAATVQCRLRMPPKDRRPRNLSGHVLATGSRGTAAIPGSMAAVTGAAMAIALAASFGGLFDD